MIFNRYVEAAVKIAGSPYAERIRTNDALFGHLRERLLQFAAAANATVATSVSGVRVVPVGALDSGVSKCDDDGQNVPVIDVDAM